MVLNVSSSVHRVGKDNFRNGSPIFQQRILNPSLIVLDYSFRRTTGRKTFFRKSDSRSVNSHPLK